MAQLNSEKEWQVETENESNTFTSRLVVKDCGHSRRIKGSESEHESQTELAQCTEQTRHRVYVLRIIFIQWLEH